MTQNHGYQQLHDALSALVVDLRAAGRADAAAAVEAAAAHYPYSMPSEFMGESGLALRRVLEERDLPPRLRSDAQRWLAAIEEGFRSVGDRVDWG